MTSNALPRPDAIAAGPFLEWLESFLRGWNSGEGSPVACGSCRACCEASFFIALEPDETESLQAIPRALKLPVPGAPHGHTQLPYDARGRCPLLGETGCTIYAERPRTCRRFDCRLFAAAGLPAGGADKAGINDRAARWAFAYPRTEDAQAHAAVRAAAAFIRDQADAFPGGRVPDSPSQLALAALHAYRLFLPGGPGHEALPEPPEGPSSSASRPSRPAVPRAQARNLAEAIIAAQPGRGIRAEGEPIGKKPGRR